jgi:hypothetical protein
MAKQFAKRISAIDDFNPDELEADLLVLSISRDEIKSGRVGHTVDRLMRLTDSKTTIMQWRGKLALEFVGYGESTRTSSETAELVQFFHAVNNQFPHWLHFCERGGKTLGQVLALLCEYKSTCVPGEDSVIDNTQNLMDVIVRLVTQMNAFYRSIGLDTKDIEQVTLEVSKGLKR